MTLDLNQDLEWLLLLFLTLQNFYRLPRSPIRLSRHTNTSRRHQRIHALIMMEKMIMMIIIMYFLLVHINRHTQGR